MWYRAYSLVDGGTVALHTIKKQFDILKNTLKHYRGILEFGIIDFYLF